MNEEIMTWEEIGIVIRSHTLGPEAIKNRDEVMQLIRMQLKDVTDTEPTNSDIGVLLLCMGESLLENTDND